MTEAVVCVKSANLIQEHGINRRKKYKVFSSLLMNYIYICKLYITGKE